MFFSYINKEDPNHVVAIEADTQGNATSKANIVGIDTEPSDANNQQPHWDIGVQVDITSLPDVEVVYNNGDIKVY